MRTIKLFLSYDLLGNLTLGNRPQGNHLKAKKVIHRRIFTAELLKRGVSWLLPRYSGAETW